MPESRSEVIGRLLNGGGKALIVGGHVSELPGEFTTHPQLVFWDDQAQSHDAKEVPDSTRLILVTRFVSHKTLNGLRKAARKMRITIFPVDGKNEIKQLVSPYVLKGAMTPAVPPSSTNGEPAKLLTTSDVPQFKTMISCVRHFFDPTNRVTEEAKRLRPILEQHGFTPTEGSLIESVSATRRGLGLTSTQKQPKVKPSAPASIPTKAPDVTMYDNVLRLVDDARAALDLLAEELPKLRNDANKVAQLRKVLEG